MTFVGTGVAFPAGATAVTDNNGHAQITAQPSASGPITITASVDGVSKSASFSESATGIPQTITFGALPGVTYGAGPITLSATASSGLPVSYTVTGPAMIASSVLGINGAGQVTVTASQPGDTSYAAATAVSQSFTVSPATPTVTWATPTAITYGTVLGAAQLNAAASVPGSFSYSPAAGVLGVGVHPLSVTFTPADRANYTVANATVPLLVNPAVLTVTANSTSAPFGTTPILGATITGFVNGDTSAAVSGAPALATTASIYSPPGSYPVTIGAGTLAAANYTFNLVGGIYTVTFTGATPKSGSLCNGAYSGTFGGNISVSAGQVCVFVGGTVAGNVQHKGGTLQLVQSRVDGNVQITGGTFSIRSGSIIAGDLQVQGTPASSATSQVCGTTIKGNVTVQNNGTAVLVGATDGSCPGDVVQGNITAQGNTAPVTVAGNTISDNLTIQSNSASTIADGNTVRGNLIDKSNTGPTQVFTDQITGSLQCSGNTSITGGSNTASSRQGQCAIF